MTESSTFIEDAPMQIVVHPGIGDISWVLSKLSTTGKKFHLVIAEDKKTRRSMPLVDMVDCVESAAYGGFDTYYILAKTGNAGFAEYEQAYKEGKILYVTANNWLEKGHRLEGYMPDLETDFHYHLNTDDDDDWAEEQLRGCPFTFGIYTSSSAGIDAWKGWSDLEWMNFIRLVNLDHPEATFVLLGAKWDRDMRLPMIEMLEKERIAYVDLIGRTSLQRAVAIIKRLNYFAGYASGLTILSNVVSTPVTMLYPKYLHKLMYSWPCPVSIANGDYQGVAWKRPIDVYNKVGQHIERCLSE